jgi:tetratricopeptide (TPR) repeat protein
MQGRDPGPRADDIGDLVDVVAVVLVVQHLGWKLEHALVVVARDQVRRGIERVPARLVDMGNGWNAVPYQPFVEALRPFAEAIGLDHVRAELGRRGADLAWLLPELDALGEPLRADPETERFRLFEAVTALAEMATRERPALLVLDDLHWAAGPTLLLLRHLIRTERPLRLLILGTYREAELDRGHPLAQLLADPQGDPSAAAVMLGGLDELGIGELLEAAAGHGLDERASGLVTALGTATAGNPFFIGEVLAHLVESGAIYRKGERWTAAQELDVPARLRHVIDHRVGRLSAPARRSLAAAAVAGPTCTLGLLEHVLDEEPELIDALEQAVAAGLLIEAGAAGYAFAHALVRQTIYRGLGSARRMRLHRRVGEALEALVPVDAYLDALASHFAQAAPDGQAAKAADYALAAGRSATAHVGYEQAAAHYERGLEALALAQPPEPQRRCELLLALGDVQWMLGNPDLARGTCLRAAELADRLGDAGRLARAALIFSGPPRVHLSGPVTESGLDLLERALTALGGDESPLCARVMSRLAVALTYLPAHREHTRTLAGAALAMARRIGEPAALAEVLASTHWATWGPDNVDERLAMNRELARRAAELGDGALAAYAHARSVSELLEVGDIDASRRELRALERLAEALQQRYPRWLVATFRAARAHLDARLEDCEAHAREGLTVGQGWNEDIARGVFAMQLVQVRWEQGRPDDALELAERLAEQYAQLPGARVLLARAYAELERDDDAREELELLARGGFADVPRDAVWLPMIYGLSQVAALLGDTRRAEQLYELLLPYADRCVVSFSTIWLDSASRPLGLLATTLSRFDDAERHFDTALTTNARIESPLYVAHTQHDYARMLLLRDRIGDPERAHELLDAALATADARGLSALANRARHPTPPRA